MLLKPFWAPFVLLLTIYENLIWLVGRVNPRLHDAALQSLDITA